MTKNDNALGDLIGDIRGIWARRGGRVQMMQPPVARRQTGPVFPTSPFFRNFLTI